MVREKVEAARVAVEALARVETVREEKLEKAARDRLLFEAVLRLEGLARLQGARRACFRAEARQLAFPGRLGAGLAALDFLRLERVARRRERDKEGDVGLGRLLLHAASLATDPAFTLARPIQAEAPLRPRHSARLKEWAIADAIGSKTPEVKLREWLRSMEPEFLFKSALEPLRLAHPKLRDELHATPEDLKRLRGKFEFAPPSQR